MDKNSKKTNNLTKKALRNFSFEKFIIRLLDKGYSDNRFGGIINNSVSNIREENRHQGQLISQALLGSPINILKEEKEWVLIQTPDQYLGWINQNEFMKIDKATYEDYKSAKKVIYHQQCGYSYSSPDIKSQIISDLVIGCILTVKNENNGFYEIKYPDNRTAFVKKDETVDIETIFFKNPQKKELVKTAKKFMGTPYLWGGMSSKLIDCSGFIALVYWLNGIVLQRDASQQIKQGREITKEFIYSDLEIGDLLFFGQKATTTTPEKITHVGMYIGHSEVIHASGRVKINSMDKTMSNYAQVLESEFIQTNRILNETKGGIEKIMQNSFYKTLISN